VRTLALAALLLLSSPNPAQETEDFVLLARQAAEAIDWRFENDWAFNQTRFEEGRVWVGRYDPRLPSRERWVLITVDGREPTEDEIEEYRDEQDEPSNSDEHHIEAIVDPDRLTLIGETDDHWQFEFVPNDDDDAFFANVRSTLKVDKAGRYLSEMDLRSLRPFKPAFGVKMKEFHTRLTFSPISDEGPVVPRSVDVKVRGRAFLVVSFDETTSIANTDFEYAGD
jgi:hypothetical protein